MLYIPDLPHNLLSVKRMQQGGMDIIFGKNGEVDVMRNGIILMDGKPLNNLIAVQFRINVSKKKTFTKAFNVEKVDHELWHICHNSCL